MSEPEHFYQFSLGDLSIGALDIRLCGKRPSLFITRGNVGRKVASFSSVQAAQYFTKAMEELLGLDDAK